MPGPDYQAGNIDDVLWVPAVKRPMGNDYPDPSPSIRGFRSLVWLTVEINLTRNSQTAVVPSVEPEVGLGYLSAAAAGEFPVVCSNPVWGPLVQKHEQNDYTLICFGKRYPVRGDRSPPTRQMPASGLKPFVTGRTRALFS